MEIIIEYTLSINKSFWDSVKAMLEGKFITVNGYIRKEERMKTSDISIYAKKLENKQKLNLIEKRNKKTTNRRQKMK